MVDCETADGGRSTNETTYYQKNKAKYQRGGKYYKYKPVEVTKPKIPLVVKKGKFIISFD